MLKALGISKRSLFTVQQDHTDASFLKIWSVSRLGVLFYFTGLTCLQSYFGQNPTLSTNRKRFYMPKKESIFGYGGVPFGTSPILLELQHANFRRTFTGTIWYPTGGLRIWACISLWDEENCCWIAVNRVIFKNIWRFVCPKNRAAIFKLRKYGSANILYGDINIKLQTRRRRFRGYLRNGQIPVIKQVMAIRRMDFFCYLGFY